MTHIQQPTQPVPAPRRRNRQATHDRLVRAALELFTTQGYHGSTTPEIAQRAGVAEGTIYRHFESKQHLLNDIYRAAARLFAGALTERPADLPCREHLERTALAWREIAARDPALVRLLFVSRLRTLLDPKSREAYGELRAGVEKVIASGKATGQVRPGPVEVWADTWLQLVSLMLERVANRDWTGEHAAPQQVIDAAWRAISLPESS